MVGIHKDRRRSATFPDLLKDFAVRHLRIRHHPIGNESSQEKAFGKTEHLGPSEQKFFGLLNLLLTLNFRFAHKNWRPAPEALRAATGRSHCSEEGCPVYWGDL